MKKSLLLFAVAALLAASAMAHGPPSQLISKDMASAGMVQKAPIGTSSSINHDLVPATPNAHGGGSGGITNVNGFTRGGAVVLMAGITKMSPGVGYQTGPPYERMLN